MYFNVISPFGTDFIDRYIILSDKHKTIIFVGISFLDIGLTLIFVYIYKILDLQLKSKTNYTNIATLFLNKYVLLHFYFSHIFLIK